MKNKVSQNKTVIQSIIGSFVVKGGSLGISVILLPLYLKFFKNQEALGIWFTILSVLNWVILFDLGLGQGLRNQLPIALSANDKKTAKEYISTTYILMICVDIIITIIGLIIIPNLNLNSIFNVDQNILSHQDLVNSVNIVFVGIMIQIVLKIVTSILYALQKSAVVNALALITNVLILTALFVVPSHGIAENLVTMSWIHVIAANLPYVVCTCYIFSKELKGAKPSLNSFSRKYINSILNVGMSLLWLQIVFMIVSSTNEILISNLTEPKDVVEYQAYYKVFKTAAIVVSLALTPIWSAVTKAQIEKNFRWIRKIYLGFLVVSVLCFVGELCLIPILQWGMNIWLGEGVVTVKVYYALIFSFSSIIFVLHNINTSIGNGLSYFKIQMIWMTFAAALFIPLSFLCVHILESWIGVVLASVLAMLPYELLAPIYTFRILKKAKYVGNFEDETY